MYKKAYDKGDYKVTTEQLTTLQRNIIVILTLTASFLSVLMMFLLITAFPIIMKEFEITSIEVQWLTTGFMLTMAILIPITAYFIDTFKTRTVMISAMSLFILGTFISLFATSFSFLLIGRIIQGIGSGIMMPLMQTILYLVYPREKRGYAMGLAGMVINVAPAIGPPISGLLINYFGWRSLFYIPLPIAIIILLLMIMFMKNVTEQRETEVDLLSILLSVIGFGGTLFGFTKLQEGQGTHTLTVISLLVGTVAIIWFVVRQLRLQIPILEMRVLKTPIFTLVASISILSFSLLIAFETIIPLFVQNAQGYSAYYGGLVVMPGAITLALMSFLAGKLFDRYGGKSIAIIGFIMISISAMTAYFLLQLETSFAVTMSLFIVAMAGSALINMPIMTIGINVLPDSLIPHGTSVINTIRQFGGTLGLIFIVSFISRQETTGTFIDSAAYLTGVKSAFFVSFLFAFIGLILSFFIKKEN